MNENKKEYLGYAIVIVIVILLRSFIIDPVMVNGSSMETTLHDENIMILSKIDYVINDIERFDIIVIQHNDDKLIKRVIGLPGETVEIKDNKLYINNIFMRQTFLDKTTITDDFKEKVEKNCYFVMGDNRENSLDSRYFGCVEKEDILGSANLVLFPFSNFGIKK